jgi:hypothetical protein
MFKLLNATKENPVLTNSVTEIFANELSITIRFKMTTWLQTWLTTRMSLKKQKQRCRIFWRKPDQKQLEFLPFWRKNSKLLERNYNYWREAASTIIRWYSMLLQIVKIIIKESFLTVRQVFSTENLRRKEAKKQTHSKKTITSCWVSDYKR